MIDIHVTEGGRLVSSEKAQKNSWIDVRDPSRAEIAELERDYNINPEHIVDIMDIDEQARIEKEDDYTLLIMRLPVYDPRYEIAYYTVPYGIFLFSDRIITICQGKAEILDEVRSGRVKGLDLSNKSAFVLRIFGRAAIVYLRYLKDINRRSASIEYALQRSVKNHELTQLLALEKSLVFFTTSLKSNEIVLEKLQSTRSIRFKEDETELLEDVLTDNKQAIEMSNIYSDILSGMMDAFASVISNNLNIQMKRLTIVSIVLMIPTLVVSLFGMNVKIPLEERPDAFLIILGVCALSGVLGALLLADKPRAFPRLSRSAAGTMVVGPDIAGRAQAARPSELS